MSERDDGRWPTTATHFAASMRAVAALASAAMIAVVVASPVAPGQPPPTAADGEPPWSEWKWYRPIRIDNDATTRWIDAVIPPAVFGEASFDLNDLRVRAADGAEVPYALRVRRDQFSTEGVPAEVFNRSTGADDARELSLDLGTAAIQHNEFEVRLAGNDFRRPAALEGSPNGETWRTLAEEDLIRFVRGQQRVEDLRLSYPPSRFRYLRLRVWPDPAVDDEPVEIDAVTVRRRVAIPGEDLVVTPELGERQPTRQAGAPASAWTLALGGDQVPVDRVEVTTPETDFVRDYVIQTAGPPSPAARFHTVASGTWRRRSGEAAEPLTAEFDEVRAARLRLIVIDHSNPPLNIRRIRFAAPVRQLVVTRPEQAEPSLRLYYGNREAIAPRYDFARNLPERLEPAPRRARLGQQQPNPHYEPEPVPVTERWPWMIYVVLAAVSVALAAVILSVARTSIALHDREEERSEEAEEPLMDTDER